MKTKAKSKTKRAFHRKTVRGRKANGPRTSIENRDLNEDEQDQITNVEKDDDLADRGNPNNNTGFSVEEEEEREKNRKVEERRPEEPMK